MEKDLGVLVDQRLSKSIQYQAAVNRKQNTLMNSKGHIFKIEINNATPLQYTDYV